jgi:hypothetical protein
LREQEIEDRNRESRLAQATASVAEGCNHVREDVELSQAKSNKIDNRTQHSNSTSLGPMIEEQRAYPRCRQQLHE